MSLDPKSSVSTSDPIHFGFWNLLSQLPPNLLCRKGFEDENDCWITSFTSNINESFIFWKHPLFPAGRTNCEHLSVCQSSWPSPNPTVFKDDNGLDINYLSPQLLGFCWLNRKLKDHLPLQIYTWKLQQMDLIYYCICRHRLLELERVLKVLQILEQGQICQLSKLF